MTLMRVEGGGVVVAENLVFIGNVKPIKVMNSTSVESVFWKFSLKSAYNAFSSEHYNSEEKANEVHDDLIRRVFNV